MQDKDQSAVKYPVIFENSPNPNNNSLNDAYRITMATEQGTNLNNIPPTQIGNYNQVYPTIDNNYPHQTQGYPIIPNTVPVTYVPPIPPSNNVYPYQWDYTYQNPHNYNYANQPYQYGYQQNNIPHDRQNNQFQNNPFDGYDQSKLGSHLSTTIRHQFVKKVLGIVGIQLLITFTIGLIVSNVNPVRNFVLTYPWLFFILAIIGVIIFCVLSCSPKLVSSYPTNVICLGIGTILISSLVALIAVTLPPSGFIVVVLITTGIVAGLMLFAMQTKYDFTGYGVYLFVAVIALSIFGIVCIFVRSNVMSMVYGGIGSLIFSLYIVYDCQLILGGKHKKHQFGVDEYVFAALSLYMDILNLFSYIAMIYRSASD